MNNYAALLSWNSSIKKVYKERFLVQVVKKILPVSVNDVAYFFADAKLVLVVLNNGRQYIVDHTLGELGKLLVPANFYRVNRKKIVNISSISSLQMAKSNKWMLHLDPKPAFSIPIPKEN